MKFIVVLLALASVCLGDVSHILQAPRGSVHYGDLPITTRQDPRGSVHYGDLPTTTTEGPPNPYSFEYKAGRFPGQVDRIQSETGDGTGRVQGSYSFIDPKFKIRTVQYTVDENGFHPSLINYDDILKQPDNSEAVRRETEKHRILYEKIAAANAKGGPQQYPIRDTVSVANAKTKHFNLFNKIAAEHAAIGEQRQAQRLAFEATSVPNEVSESEAYFNRHPAV